TSELSHVGATSGRSDGGGLHCGPSGPDPRLPRGADQRARTTDHARSHAGPIQLRLCRQLRIEWTHPGRERESVVPPTDGTGRTIAENVAVETEPRRTDRQRHRRPLLGMALSSGGWIRPRRTCVSRTEWN